MIKAKVLAHSISPDNAEAVTFSLTLPRIVLSEFNTHRKFSRNTSSSRAIPIKKMIKHVRDNMFYPVYWGKNQSGMQAKEELTGIRLWMAKRAWRLFGLGACVAATILNKLGVHKQITNRLIENFSYVTVVFTTTDIRNFMDLRHHPDAQPEIYEAARAIAEAYKKSTPKKLNYGEWHLPFITPQDREDYRDIDVLIKISAARCASTSYQTVDGKPIHAAKAIEIEQKLAGSVPIHASPFEHQLTPDRLVDVQIREKGKRKWTDKKVWKNPHLHGNTIGFIQNRKLIKGESSSNDLPHFVDINTLV